MQNKPLCKNLKCTHSTVRDFFQKKGCKKTLRLTNFKTVQINFVVAVFCHPRKNFYLMMKYRKRAKKKLQLSSNRVNLKTNKT